jgi:hypothetical protein
MASVGGQALVGNLPVIHTALGMVLLDRSDAA